MEARQRFFSFLAQCKSHVRVLFFGCELIANGVGLSESSGCSSHCFKMLLDTSSDFFYFFWVMDIYFSVFSIVKLVFSPFLVD